MADWADERERERERMPCLSQKYLQIQRRKFSAICQVGIQGKGTKMYAVCEYVCGMCV